MVLAAFALITPITIAIIIYFLSLKTLEWFEKYYGLLLTLFYILLLVGIPAILYLSGWIGNFRFF